MPELEVAEVDGGVTWVVRRSKSDGTGPSPEVDIGVVVAVAAAVLFVVLPVGGHAGLGMYMRPTTHAYGHNALTHQPTLLSPVVG